MSKPKRYLMLAAVLVFLLADVIYFSFNPTVAAALVVVWPALKGLAAVVLGVMLLAAIVAGISIWLKARSARHA